MEEEEEADTNVDDGVAAVCIGKQVLECPSKCRSHFHFQGGVHRLSDHIMEQSHSKPEKWAEAKGDLSRPYIQLTPQ